METNARLLPKKKKKRLDGGANLFVCVMLAWPIFQFLVYWVFININSVLMAFKIPTGDWSLLSLKIVWNDILHGSGTDISLAVSLKNTLIYFIKDTIMLFFQLFIAYVFYKKVMGYHVFQIILYLPTIVSGVAISTMFRTFISPNGVLGEVFELLGWGQLPNLLRNSDYANGTLLFYTIWLGWGGNMLLLGGALARIPVEIVESARLDGISTTKELTHIIFPLVWPTFSTLFILMLTSIFANSGPVLLFTQGNYGTSTVGYWLYHKVYFDGVSAYNEVSAAGLIFTAIGVPIIMFIRWLINLVPTVEY